MEGVFVELALGLGIDPGTRSARELFPMENHSHSKDRR